MFSGTWKIILTQIVKQSWRIWTNKSPESDRGFRYYITAKSTTSMRIHNSWGILYISFTSWASFHWVERRFGANSSEATRYGLRVVRSFWNLTYVLATVPPMRLWNIKTCWRHQMETFSALLTLCAGNFFFFDLCLNKQSSKQPRRRWFETVVRSSYLHNGISCTDKVASLYWTNPEMFKTKLYLMWLKYINSLCLDWESRACIICTLSKYLSSDAYFIMFWQACTISWLSCKKYCL